MKSMKMSAPALGSKRKLSESNTNDLMEEHNLQYKRSASTNNLPKVNPAAFPSSSGQNEIGSAEAMKRSTSWPGSVSSRDSTEYSQDSLEALSNAGSYADNVLDSKFQQQDGMVLKSSVFRTQAVGVTKILHSKACELIAGGAHSYGVCNGTAMLGMQLFDRALSLTVVRKNEVTLLAATCLFIAAKLEEINPPYAEELAYYCGKRFSKEDVHSMEQILLPLFQCQVAMPTRWDFAQRFSVAADLSARERSVVSFLLELSYLDYNLNYFVPSKVAAGAIHLTLQMLRHGPKGAIIWSAELERAARCTERDLVEIVLRLRQVHWDMETCAMKNILQRYTGEAHYGLSELAPLPYSQLRFDSHVLPKLERELPDYATCPEEKVDPALFSRPR